MPSSPQTLHMPAQAMVRHVRVDQKMCDIVNLGIAVQAAFSTLCALEYLKSYNVAPELIERVLLHPDPVAEDGAAGKRARRIDRDDPDRLSAFPQVRGDPVDEGRLSRARRPRDTEDVGASRVPIQFLQGPDRRRDFVVQVPHQPRLPRARLH